MAALQLYHNDMSSCSQKVRIALSEKKLSNWENCHLQLRRGEHLKPDYVKNLNPKGVVPTLVHNGTPIRESQVILEYIDEAFPNPPLRPASAVGKAEMRLWTKQVDEDIHSSIGVVTMATGLRNHKARNIAKRNPSQAARVMELIEKGTDAPAFTVAINRFNKLFADIDASLKAQGGADWLVENRYSLADVSFTPYAKRLETMGLLQPMLQGKPHAAAWWSRVKQRESWAEALIKWDIPHEIGEMEEKGRQHATKVEEILAGPAAPPVHPPAKL
eukprot:TRINITY_DN75385_c0_g1_i1.p1 TRINITY_DN75385_c0_g1~~TRINITY_DN75385_c0_g1_i1.p1  ORF type:complete len:288 (+),score=23.99 TRINITY_DN75385_c0_g1_i1:44-865(+)